MVSMHPLLHTLLFFRQCRIDFVFVNVVVVVVVV